MYCRIHPAAKAAGILLALYKLPELEQGWLIPGVGRDSNSGPPPALGGVVPLNFPLSMRDGLAAPLVRDQFFAGFGGQHVFAPRIRGHATIGALDYRVAHVRGFLDVCVVANGSLRVYIAERDLSGGCVHVVCLLQP